METKSIAQLRKYLDQFKKDVAEVDIKRLEEVPKFGIPNWPKEVKTDRIRFRLGKKIFKVEIGKETNLPRLKTKFFPKVGFHIDSGGGISMEISHRGAWSADYLSNTDDMTHRLACFVLFSQCLDEICGRVIKLLTNKLIRRKIEKEDYERLTKAVKKSFEPLIPFVVADILSEERS